MKLTQTISKRRKIMKQLGFMARNQYGETIHFPNEQHPRKALLQHFGRKHADKMYVNTKDGKEQHVGYIIAGNWLTIFRVFSWK
jgi:hypothetical protein